MTKQFPGETGGSSSHEAPSDTTDYIADFYQARADMFRSMTPLLGPISSSQLDEQIEQLLQNVDKVADAFAMASHFLLGQDDLEAAVQNWVAFAIKDEDDRYEESFKLSGLDLLEPLDKAKLPEYAWDYIAINNLDLYDKYGLGDRQTAGDWVTETYPERLQYLVGETLDYAMSKKVSDAYRAALSDEPIPTLYPQMTEIIDSLKNDINSSSYHSVQHYLQVQRLQLEQRTTIYPAFERQLDRLYGLEDARAEGKRIPPILTGTAFRDGFIAALAVNSWLLSADSEQPAMQELNVLTPFIDKLFDTYTRRIQGGEGVDVALYDQAYMLTNQPDLHAFVNTMNHQLYGHLQPHNQEIAQSCTNSYVGFAIGHELYCLYYKYVQQGLSKLEDTL